MNFSSVKNIHFVGIGGIGMSGIAEILMSQGFTVSGSDLHNTEVTEYLEGLGARICYGHAAENVGSAEVVVYSSAVKPLSNVETVYATDRKIPIIRRAEMLSEISRLKYCLAIAGTHGKTTTTSMCGLIMMQAEMDPTVIVGGKLKGLGGTNARLGNGEWIVLEADEYDRSFLQLLPTIALVTNIEADHLDIYSDLDDIKEAFIEFTNKVPFYGTACVCLDDAGVRDILPLVKRVVITYGMSPQCDVRADNVEFDENLTRFDLIYKGQPMGEIQLNVPGDHNVRNALGACAMALQCDISFSVIHEALKQFTGVYRRFELMGEKDGIMVVDDYAHHPTEIKVTLKAAREGWDRRIIAVFQPHTYSRTKDFYKDFALSFDDADIMVITDVYPAREAPIEGISGQLIADAAKAAGHKAVMYIPNRADVASTLRPLLSHNDLVLTLGAGDVWMIGQELLN